MLVVPLQSVWAVTPFVAVGYLACRTPVIILGECCRCVSLYFQCIVGKLGVDECTTIISSHETMSLVCVKS